MFDWFRKLWQKPLGKYPVKPGYAGHAPPKGNPPAPAGTPTYYIIVWRDENNFIRRFVARNAINEGFDSLQPKLPRLNYPNTSWSKRFQEALKITTEIGARNFIAAHIEGNLSAVSIVPVQPVLPIERPNE